MLYHDTKCRNAANYELERVARIDPVQLGGADQGIHEGRALPAALGTGEEPGFSAKGDTAQRSFRRVVGEANPAIVKEPGEAGPVFGREQIVDGLGDLGVLREAAIRGEVRRPCLPTGLPRRRERPCNAKASTGCDRSIRDPDFQRKCIPD